MRLDQESGVTEICEDIFQVFRSVRYILGSTRQWTGGRGKNWEQEGWDTEVLDQFRLRHEIEFTGSASRNTNRRV